MSELGDVCRVPRVSVTASGSEPGVNRGSVHVQQTRRPQLGQESFVDTLRLTQLPPKVAPSGNNQ